MNELDDQPIAPARAVWKRLAPLAALFLGAAAVFATGAHRYLSLSAVREHYLALEALVEANFAAALAAYMLAYMLVAALSLPGGAVMSLLGGFLFGVIVGAAAAVTSATIGGTIVFLAARTAIGDYFRKRAHGALKAMEQGFERNAFSYLLFLRLIPIFPFFIVNFVPALARVPTKTFVTATFLGIIPGALAYVSAGAGLGVVFARGEELRLVGLLAQPEIIAALVLMSALALGPLVWRALKKRKSEGPAA